jgi:hypothetical protein
MSARRAASDMHDAPGPHATNKATLSGGDSPYNNAKDGDPNVRARRVGLLILTVVVLVLLALPNSSDSFEHALHHARVRAGSVGPCADRLHEALHLESSSQIDLSGCGLGREGRLEAARQALRAAPLEWRASVKQLDLSKNELPTVDFGFFFEDVSLKNPIFPSLTTLFLTENRLTLVPPALRKLVTVTRLSLKSNLITGIDANLLPPGLVHLILTDNRIRTARNFHALVELRKLMLSGNELTSPCSFVLQAESAMPVHAHAPGPTMPSLELLRLGRNKIASLSPAEVECFDPEHGAFPRLRWLSLAGNPLVVDSGLRVADKLLDLSNVLDCAGKPVLGAGASGEVRRCTLSVTEDQARALLDDSAPAAGASPTAASVDVAVKFFKNVSSDGSAGDELLALASLPTHPNVLRPLGFIPAGCPQAPHGAVVMPLMTSPRPLGKAPTIDTVTQDRFDDDAPKAFASPAAVSAALADVAAAMAAVHKVGLAHGDLYAHNIFFSGAVDKVSGGGAAASNLGRWLAAHAVGSTDRVTRLSDFGAGFLYGRVTIKHPRRALSDDEEATASRRWRAHIEALEVRSFGVLVDDAARHWLPAGAAADPSIAAEFSVLVNKCGGPLNTVLASHAVPGRSAHGSGTGSGQTILTFDRLRESLGTQSG